MIGARDREPFDLQLRILVGRRAEAFLVPTQRLGCSRLAKMKPAGVGVARRLDRAPEEQVVRADWSGEVFVHRAAGVMSVDTEQHDDRSYRSAVVPREQDAALTAEVVGDCLPLLERVALS